MIWGLFYAVAIERSLSNPKGVCFLCGMQAKGFVVQFNPLVHVRTVKSIKSDINLTLKRDYDQYSCCSLECQNTVLKIVSLLRGGMSQQTITNMEQKAIQDAKTNLYNALVAIGSAEAFASQTSQNMEYIIWEVWSGLRKSMQTQSEQGEIPF